MPMSREIKRNIFVGINIAGNQTHEHKRSETTRGQVLRFQLALFAVLDQ